MNNINKVINKGVPISTPIVILERDLVDISNNGKKLEEQIIEKFYKYLDFIAEKCGKSNNVEFFMTTSIVSDPQTLEKKLCFSETGLINSIIFGLNIDNVCDKITQAGVFSTSCYIEDFLDVYKDRIEDKIKSLRLISREDKLEKKFPRVYAKYKESEEYYKNLKEIKKSLENPKVDKMQALKVKAVLANILNDSKRNVDINKELEKAEKFSLYTFCNECADIYQEIINNFDEIVNFLYNYTIDINNTGINSEKLELYIVNQFIESCNLNPDVKQRYIYYVSDYYNRDKSRRNDEKNYIEINRNGSKKRITPASLYKEYCEILKNNPEIKVVDLSKVDFSTMNLKEVEEFVMEFLKDLQANWEIIPETNYNNTVVEHLKGNYSGTTTYNGVKVSEEKLLEMFIDKKEFFASTDPFFRIKGKKTFEGYIGYIYTNGKVVLEKYYDKVSTGKLAYGDAIYVMNIEDFYRLSQFPKRVLMSDPSVERKVHNGNWQDEIRKIISKENQKAKTAEELKQLVKTKKIEEE